MTKERLFIVLGQLSLFLGIQGFFVNTLILDNKPVISFLTGLFLGLGFVMNLASLIMIRKK